MVKILLLILCMVFLSCGESITIEDDTVNKEEFAPNLRGSATRVAKRRSKASVAARTATTKQRMIPSALSEMKASSIKQKNNIARRAGPKAVGPKTQSMKEYNRFKSYAGSAVKPPQYAKDSEVHTRAPESEYLSASQLKNLPHRMGPDRSEAMVRKEWKARTRTTTKSRAKVMARTRKSLGDDA